MGQSVQTDYAGVIEQSCASLPYGDGESCYQGPTEHLYAGLERDEESGQDHAAYRQYAFVMGRWTAPDPYNGSYDLENPQSLNRYAYVDGNPLDATDPTGLAGAGILTGVGGAPCKAFGVTKAIASHFNFDGLSFNPCNPIGSAISDVVTLVAAYADAYQTGQGIGSILGTWHVDSQTGMAGSYDSTLSGIAASVGAAITIACSIDSNSDLCGQTSWTSALIGGNSGKVVGDSIAVAGAITCFAGPEACLGNL